MLLPLVAVAVGLLASLAGLRRAVTVSPRGRVLECVTSRTGALMDLEIRDLTIEYSSGGQVVRPVNGLNLTASTGSLVLLLGPSGCGKTTLLSCLGGILAPTHGQMTFGDTDISTLSGKTLTAVPPPHRGHRVPGVQPRPEPHDARERHGPAAATAA